MMIRQRFSTFNRKISCEIASNPNFFPPSLPRFCPIKNGNFGEIIGCALNTSINTTSFIAHNFNTSIMCIVFCLKYEAPFAAYSEFTGHCNCWRIFNNALVNNIFAINHTCSDWFADNDNGSIADTVTLYRTSFVPVGTGFKPEAPPNQISLVFFFLVSGRKSLRQNRSIFTNVITIQIMINIFYNDSISLKYLHVRRQSNEKHSNMVHM
ncbi:unnamed protein product [Rotaria magnacalcarata]